MASGHGDCKLASNALPIEVAVLGISIRAIIRQLPDCRKLSRIKHRSRRSELKQRSMEARFLEPDLWLAVGVKVCDHLLRRD